MNWGGFEDYKHWGCLRIIGTCIEKGLRIICTKAGLRVIHTVEG